MTAIYSTSDIIEANKRAGYYFFSSNTMASFGTRVYDKVFDNLCFVTSERDKGVYIGGVKYAAWDGKRRYTVSQFNPETGYVRNVSEFGQFATKAAAERFAERYPVSAAGTTDK